MVRPFLIDCDTGTDDAIALAAAFGCPEIEVKAITSVNGNVAEKYVCQNNLDMAEYLGYSGPVCRGAVKPFHGSLHFSDGTHGRTGLGDVVLPQAKTKQFDPRLAPEMIHDAAVAEKGNLEILATGPMTNLAMALRLEPRIAQKIQKIVLMGGSAGFGNTTPAAEFNIYADPEAAAVVYSSGVPIVMMGLDLTEQTVVDDSTLKRLRGLGNRAGSLCADILQEQIDQHAYQVHVHDVTTVMYVSEPQLFSLKPVYAEIDLSHGPCYGRTVCDLNNRYHKAANVEIGLQLDCDRFWAGVEERLSHLA